MATHSSVLAWRLPMNKRSLAGYSLWSDKELNRTEVTAAHTPVGFLLQTACTHLLVSTSATKELPERPKTEAGTNFASLVETHLQVNTVKKSHLATFSIIKLQKMLDFCKAQTFRYDKSHYL